MPKSIFQCALLGAFALLTACSSVTTTELSTTTANANTPPGLTYFMPRKDVTVEIEITEVGEDGSKHLKVNDVTIGTTAAYADRSKVYLLNHGTNWLADNKLTIKVNSAGLLETATAQSISQVEEAFVNLAKSSAVFDFAGAGGGNRSLTCTRPGKYSFVVDISDQASKDMCGVTVQITPVRQPGNGDQLPSRFSNGSGKALSGLYYRQEIPYLVTAEHIDGSETLFRKQVVVTSPSESNTRFLPISKSFFADSTATFTLVDGVPTDYDQDDKSELVGAFIIPAKVFGAYFEAAGQIFTAFSQRNSNEIALIESEKNLEIAEHNAQRDLEAALLAADRKYEVDAAQATLTFEITKKKLDLCIAAVENGNQQLIDDLKCAEL